MCKTQLSAPPVSHSDSVLLCFVLEDVQFSLLSDICACLCCPEKCLCAQIFTEEDDCEGKTWTDARVLRLRTLAEEDFTLQNVNSQGLVFDINPSVHHYIIFSRAAG